ncbi:hypothetical protein G647_02826 [Cladophialophora carrionii CBS 160.54]|uniref:Uncharacterized protein n=1 Tax=Cladophialophora carrionii CBS 160.54 TaxID=1279043 RepID=V9DGN6_9EURO|nr:uncharacterized protein G647_02826 [Cladophialophora carrionii CBS 160.54]ETI26049.1 hypothetical protein G647_02826 [Cladophialophora carrionii CBS 160.54]
MSANTYRWSPDVVFQITDEVRKEMVCMGRVANKMNARCRWAIGAHFASRPAQVRELLQAMGSMIPKQITNRQVEQLAKLCLCKFHGRQLEDATIELLNRRDNAIRNHDQFVHGRARRYSAVFGGDEEEEHGINQLGVGFGNLSLGGGGERHPTNRSQ